MTTRVSRRDLAHNRFTWRATSGMVLFLAITAAVMSVVNTTAPPLRLEIAAAVWAGIGLTLLRKEPPGIGTVANHVVVALPWLGAASLFWAFKNDGGAAIGAAIFVGPLAAVRLENRLHIGGHLAAASGLFLLLSVFGGVNTASILCMLVAIPAMWTLGACCCVVLEGAEAQGAELERLVRRDPLTGAGNRRLLDERLANELQRHARIERELSIVALDLNGFKALNDTMGHAAGDALLRDVARALSQVTGPNETVVRQGGDEFCLVLPETSPKHAARVVNAVRAALARLEFDGISAGFGIASFPDDAVTGDVLLHVADERLRTDKAQSPSRRAAAATPAQAPEPAASPLRVSA